MMKTTAKIKKATYLVFASAYIFLFLGVYLLSNIVPKAAALILPTTKAEIDKMAFTWVDPWTITSTLAGQPMTFEAGVNSNIATSGLAPRTSTFTSLDYFCGSSGDEAGKPSIILAAVASQNGIISSQPGHPTQLHMRYQDAQGCQNYTLNIVISNSQFQNSKIGWADAGNIRTFAQLNGIFPNTLFTKDTDGRFYRQNETDACKDVIIVTGSTADVIELKLTSGGVRADQIGVGALDPSCRVLSINGTTVNSTAQAKSLLGGSLPLAGLANATKPAGTGAGVNGAGGAAQEEDTCEFSDSGPLGWILCPMIDLGVGFSGAVFGNFIQPFLEESPVSTNPNDPTYGVWKEFRLIGNILMIGTMLAVVYAQLKG